ncbi:hypothetical protein [Lentilitoribacter sp. EG35]|uniref:hypothetical protein n=1 Tax=Lentilitoribacter sp. EG35 TaxID=3234192 RepID=UPI003460CDD4
MELPELKSHILELAKDKQRFIVGIAGPPASGKSTLAESLCQNINNSVVVPMDGFHLPNDVLEQRGMLERKGAHFTFDAEGFIQLVSQIRNTEKLVEVPEFDRSQDEVVFNKLTVSSENKIVIIEGNYLLLDEEPWSALKSMFDVSICISPQLEEIKRRLLMRWLDHGYSESDALRKVQSNDLPNAQYILEHSSTSDIMLNG